MNVPSPSHKYVRPQIDCQEAEVFVAPMNHPTGSEIIQAARSFFRAAARVPA